MGYKIVYSWKSDKRLVYDSEVLGSLGDYLIIYLGWSSFWTMRRGVTMARHSVTALTVG